MTATPHTLLLMLSLLCSATPVWAAEPASGAASAASAPTPARAPGARPALPERSPAVKAADDAEQPGKVRPRHPVVPQIAVPLRRGADAPAASASSAMPASRPPDGVDDRAARCLAMKTPAERAQCAKTDGPKRP
ncbi:MAG: hypothetical protein ABIX12_09125 [Rubrivivax sp.]